MILLVLVLVGLAAGIWAIELFPDRPPLMNPTPFIIQFDSEHTLSDINLEVSLIARSARIAVSADPASSPAGTQNYGSITIFLYGVFPLSCPPPARCYPGVSQPSQTVIDIPITVNNAGLGDEVFHSVTVRDPLLGFTSNGESAIAELPLVHVLGSGASGLNVTYEAPGADSYDWSIPPNPYGPINGVSYYEPLAGNSYLAASNMEITGTNYRAQANDNRNTFISGILLGVAGGAVIAAVQDGLHMLYDNDADRRRPKSARRQSTART